MNYSAAIRSSVIEIKGANLLNRRMNRFPKPLVFVGCFILCFQHLPLADLSAQEKEVDVEALAALGLEVLQSDHLTLITDVRRDDVQQFNDVFEQAVGQWATWFAIPDVSTREWHITGCIMLNRENRQKFVAAGLIPDDLPEFPAGYQRDRMIWLYLQDGDYYTRHLLLHEGTHAFMQEFLGGYGPPWYAEGMAELLAVHQWQDGHLKIHHRIASREEVPFWGRVKLVRRDRDSGQPLSLDQILAIEPEAFQRVRFYGWAWAACEFFDSHPDFKETFRRLPSLANVPAEEFNVRFLSELSASWPAANTQWQMMVEELDYGYDVAKAAPRPVTGRVQSGSGVRFDLSVDRGWQETGIAIRPGSTLRISAGGQFQIKDDGSPWLCEAGGVTMEYYRGRPLGRLTAGVKPEGENRLSIIDIGTGGEFSFETGGQLFMRVNESPSAWSDNEGTLKIVIESD